MIQESGVNAAAIASMVDLSAEEIEDLLTLGYELPCKQYDNEYTQQGIHRILQLIKDSIKIPQNHCVGGDTTAVPLNQNAKS